MKVQQIFFKNTLRNFSYLITFNDGAIFCIDPFNAAEVLKSLEKDSLKGIINTHDHCDHHSGNEALVEKFHCEVLGHEKAQIPHKTRGLHHQEVVYQSGPFSLLALDTPGHTLSHICLLLKKEEQPYAIFTGDCFFNAGVGNCYNGGDVGLMYKTIKNQFSHFPDELLIYPGHEYFKRNLEFTLSVEKTNKRAEAFLDKIKSMNMDEDFFINNMKTERAVNTFLRLKEPEIKSALGLTESSEEDIFYKLREKRNHW